MYQNNVVACHTIEWTPYSGDLSGGLMRDDVTQLIADWQNGDRAALDKLGSFLYDELHRIAAAYMRREGPGNDLQPTALVNEAFVRLLGTATEFVDRKHFFALAAQIMRRVLVDQARERNAAKRGSGIPNLTFDEALVAGDDRNDILELDAAMSELSKFDPRLARAIELRYFGGLSISEAAEVMSLSESTLNNDLRLARAWLKNELN